MSCHNGLSGLLFKFVGLQKGGPYLAIYLWAFMFVLSIMIMTLYPILILLLFLTSSLLYVFRKLSSTKLVRALLCLFWFSFCLWRLRWWLPEGVLREKIEKLASSLKFPLKKWFVVDGSTRLSHSNVSLNLHTLMGQVIVVQNLHMLIYFAY